MVKRAVSQLIEMIEVRVFHVSEQESERGEQKLEVEGRTLLPPLSDELMLGRVWPLLHRRVNISLLWWLRRVNKAWKRQVGTTVEWAALEMVRVDSPGLLQVLAVRNEPLPSLRERVDRELRAFTILLAERLVDFSDRSGVVQPPIDSPGRVEIGRGERLSTRVMTWDSESESASGSCSSQGVAKFKWSESFPCRGREDSERSEEEEIEAYASSIDSSMRVYYPRHWLRNQTG